jgi:hypothetical protein
MSDRACVVVAWHNPEQREKFLAAWGIGELIPPLLYLQQDKDRSGCALTKNRGVIRAIDDGYDIICVLDDDCFPSKPGFSLENLVQRHCEALQPQQVKRFEVVTNPPSRGTPYFNRTAEMPVAASMGYWIGVGDYDAPSQLVHGAQHPMEFRQEAIFGQYFALSGMNIAFRASWWPYCQFVNVPRMDDIWMGFIWQRRAYDNGHCFNLNGPLVRHSRQSNVWANLKDEARHLEANETIWRKVLQYPAPYEYEDLAKLLPL